MAKLILPKNRLGPSEEIRIPVDAIEMPAALKEDFSYNSHLEPVFYTAVGRALNETFAHPETKMREPTEQAIKERIKLCYDTVIVLRYDLKYSLRKALDLLPKFVLRAMLEGKKPADLFEKDAQGNMWGRGDSERVIMSRQDLEDDTITEDDPDPTENQE